MSCGFPAHSPPLLLPHPRLAAVSSREAFVVAGVSLITTAVTAEPKAIC